MKNYRQKGNPDSLTLEGIEWTGTNELELREFITDRYFQVTDHCLIINGRTVDTETKVIVGAVIVKTAGGDYAAIDKNLVEEV